MKMAQNMDMVMKIVQSMSEHEQASVIERIMDMLANQSDAKVAPKRERIAEAYNQKPNCPHCGANSSMGLVIKKGNHKGVQRFYCKKCEHYFVSTTNTVFENTRKSADVWRKFIHMTIDGKSLHYCASNCHVAYQTAFTWRHKILNAFVVNQNATMMNGTIELDEMLIPLSYKGNHIKGTGFGARKLSPDRSNSGIPRPAFERGSDNRSMSSKDKACVFCMVEDGNKSFYTAVPGVGFMNPEMLDMTVSKHINKQTSLLLADNYRTTKNYLEANGYRYESFHSNTTGNERDHKPEVRDGKHLQHVNAMHRHIRLFLARYCGVSSKYLENYLSLYVWLKSFCKSNPKYMESASEARASVQDCYITRKALEKRPAVPCCA